MAKSIRSKVKRHHKAIRRKDVYAPVEEARLNKLAARQNGESIPDSPPKRFSFLEKAPSKSIFVQDVPRDVFLSREMSDIPEQDESDMPVDATPLTKLDKQKLFLSRNAFKKKIIAANRAKKRTGKIHKK